MQPLYRVEKPSVNDWLTCPDISVWYELFGALQARSAWQSGREAAKDVDARLRRETEHLRRR
jgi:hypothetical protein